MTIASVNINFQLAFRQGWTKEDVESYINDILTELQQGEDNVVEFDVTSTVVNADPFNRNAFLPAMKLVGPPGQLVPMVGQGIYQGPRP